MKSLLNYLLALIFCCCLFSCRENPNEKESYSEVTAITLEEEIERGEYLVRVIGCDHCHTPKKMTEDGPVPDMDRWLMGFPATDTLPTINKEEVAPGKWVMLNGDLTAAVGPWGVSFGGNLTPHETGIGNWTYDNFKRAMTQGVYKGIENSRPLMPPMPWQSYREMKEEDLKAIFAYLKQIKPIENLVPAYIPPPDM